MRSLTAAVPLHLLHGEGSPLAPAIAAARRIGDARSNAAVCGPTGSGKETLARLIHACGGEPEETFFAVPCAGRAEGELAEELVSGAGALLAPTHRGTVFLEDASELPLSLQGRVVRALDLAGRAHVRIVAASTRDLVADVASGRFRRDLYDLLACPLRIPALRERPDDVLLVFERCWEEMRPGCPLDAGAGRLLRAYHWPGNVREVAAVARRIAASASPRSVTARDVERAVLAGTFDGGWMAARDGGETAARDAAALGIPALASVQRDGDRIDLAVTLRRVETELIRWALERSRGSKAAAARLLGLRRTTFAEKLRRLEGDGAASRARTRECGQAVQISPTREGSS